MLNFDPYEALGVSRNADVATIKKTYRARALDYHPDRHPNDPRAGEMIRKINAAYDVLSDSAKKADYDLKWKRSQSRPPQTATRYDYRQYGNYSAAPEQPHREKPRHGKSRRDHGFRRTRSSRFSPVYFFVMISIVFGLAFRQDIKSFFAEKKYDRMFSTVAGELKNISGHTTAARMGKSHADLRTPSIKNPAKSGGRSTQVASAEIHGFFGSHGRVSYQQD